MCDAAGFIILASAVVILCCNIRAERRMRVIIDQANTFRAEARFYRDAWKFANLVSRATLSQQTFNEEEK
jgi:hypothetical protein